MLFVDNVSVLAGSREEVKEHVTEFVKGEI